MAPAKSNSPVADKIDQQAHNGRREHAPFDLDDLDIPGGVPVGPIFNQNGQDVTGQFPSLDNIKQAIVKMLKNQKREQHHFNAATAPHHHVRGNDDVEFIDVSRRQVDHPHAHPGHHLQHATGANADMSRRQAAGGQHPTSEPPSSVKYPHPHSEHPEPHPHPHPEPQASSVKHITTDDNDESDTSSSFGHDDDDDEDYSTDQEYDFREEMQDAIDDLSDEMNDVSNDLDHLDRRNDDAAAEESSKLAKSIEGLAKQMDKIDDDLEDLDRRDDEAMPGLAKSIQGLSQQMDEVDEMLKKKGKKGLGRPHDDDDDDEDDDHKDKDKKKDMDDDRHQEVDGDAQVKDARPAATATAVQAKRQVHTIMYSYSIPTPPPVPSVPAIPGQSSSSSAQKGKQSGGSKHKQQRRSPSSHPAQHPAAGGDSGLSLILHKKSPRTDSYQAPAAPTAPAAPSAPNAPKAPAVPAIPSYKKRLFGYHSHGKSESNIKCADSSSAQQQQPGKRLFGVHKHKSSKTKSEGCPPPAAAAKAQSKHAEDEDQDSDDDDHDERHRGTPQQHHRRNRDDKAALSSPDIERLHRAYHSSRNPPASRRQDYQAIDLAFSASTPTNTSSATASGYNSSTLGTNLSCLESLGLIVVVFAVLMSIVGWLGAKRAYYARRRQQARREHQAATAAAHAKAMVLGTADELGDETVVAAEVCLHAEDQDADADKSSGGDRSQRDGAAATQGSNGRAERQSLLLDSREQEEQQRYEVVAIAQLS